MWHAKWLPEIDDATDEAYPLRWVSLVFICLAIFISTVDSTIVNVALPSIAEDLNAGTSGLQWVMDGFSIAAAGFILLGAGVADRYGRKGTFMAGFALFGAASISGALAQTIEMLVVSRVAMGLGAALIYPPALALLAVTFAPAERRKAVAVWAGMGGAGLALGPTIGGILLSHFWWGSVLLVNVPVAVVGLIGAAVTLPRSRRPGAPALDVVGAALSVVALVFLVFGIIEGPNRGWTSPGILGVIGLGLAGAVAFVLWELRAPHPMLDLRIFRSGGVIGGTATFAVGYLSLTGVLFVLPSFVQYVLGDSTLVSGIALMPLGVIFVIFSFLSPMVARRIGDRGVITIGLVTMAVGCCVMALLARTGGYGVVAVGMAIYGLGLGLTGAPGTAVILEGVPTSKAGDGSAASQLSRQLGAAFGVAVIGTVLASTYASGLDPSTADLPAAQASAATASVAGAYNVAEQLDPTAGASLTTAANTAFDDAARTSLLVTAVILAIGAAISWSALRSKDPDPSPQL
jgi:EmrB/QacA subfamily drug resistance transporter